MPTSVARVKYASPTATPQTSELRSSAPPWSVSASAVRWTGSRPSRRCSSSTSACSAPLGRPLACSNGLFFGGGTHAIYQFGGETLGIAAVMTIRALLRDRRRPRTRARRHHLHPHRRAPGGDRRDRRGLSRLRRRLLPVAGGRRVHPTGVTSALASAIATGNASSTAGGGGRSHPAAVPGALPRPTGPRRPFTITIDPITTKLIVINENSVRPWWPNQVRPATAMSRTSASGEPSRLRRRLGAQHSWRLLQCRPDPRAWREALTKGSHGDARLVRPPYVCERA
jgi:hypothetical protein